MTRHSVRLGRILLTLSTIALVLSALAIPQSAIHNPQSAFAAPTGTTSTNSVYYRQTAHYLKDSFLHYWLMNGGVNLYGYPISEEFTLDGKSVQYFERARFEYNPASSRPWKVDLTNIGSLVSDGRAFPPGQQSGGREYYPQTLHTLGGAFYQFWRANGGLDKFGYPISEELQERGMSVQYFERARFELAAPGRVQLGRVGAELMQKHLDGGAMAAGQVTPRNRPGFSMNFQGNSTQFHADWERVIKLNKGWGNLPQNYVGRGLYAAMPADLGLYGRWARVTRGNRSVFVQIIDVINWPDIPYVRSKGIVIDLGDEAYRALGRTNGSRYDVTVDVFWPGEEP